MIKYINNYSSWDYVFIALSKIKKFKKGKSVLQIGVKNKPYGVSNWLKMFKEFEKFGYQTFDVLEIWENNLKKLYNWDKLGKKFLGDVRNIDEIIQDKYDVYFWYGGPEHIKKEEFKKLQIKFNNFKDSLMVISCPNGEVIQGIHENNPHEEHKSYWIPEELENLGYDVWVFGGNQRKDLLGIKYIK